MTLLRFTRGSGLGAAVVRIGTWSWCAHVGFKLESGIVLDATPECGVAFRDAKDDETTQYYRPLAPKAHVDAAVRWAMLQVGRPYDWTAIYGMFVRRDWHKDDKWFCSELICGAFGAAQWPLLQDQRLYDRISPRDLLLSPRIKRVATPAVRE
jgi:uncharacterized protein YycO